MKQINFNNHKTQLTEQDVNELVSIITYRCRAKTTNRVRSILTYSPSLIPQYGIFNRLIKDNNRWEYVAGQSYPDEIKTLRDCILKGYVLCT